MGRRSGQIGSVKREGAMVVTWLVLPAHLRIRQVRRIDARNPSSTNYSIHGSPSPLVLVLSPGVQNGSSLVPGNFING